MGWRIFITTVIFTLLMGTNASAQRRVDVSIEGLFSFYPLSGYYCKNSLPAVATYVEAWREQGEVHLRVVDSLSWGYRHYCNAVDSTLLPRVMDYIGGELVEADSTMVLRDISDFPQSRSFNEHFASDIEAIKRYFATPLRVFDTTLRYNPYGSSDFESLFHTFQSDITGAELSLFAPTRLDGSLPCELYIRQVVELIHYNNDLVVVEISGRELRQIMERSYSTRYYSVKRGSDDLLRHRSPAYYHLSISGVPHTVNLSKDRGARVENWPLDAKKLYRVAVNSFLGEKYPRVGNYGDYKSLIVEWLRGVVDPFKSEVMADLQPSRLVDEIKQREWQTIVW